MVSASKVSWFVAATMASVETFKDQAGLCRWNYALRSVHQQAKSKMGSFSQARRLTSSYIEERITQKDVEKAMQSEEALRKVLYLSCWGPN